MLFPHVMMILLQNFAVLAAPAASDLLMFPRDLMEILRQNVAVIAAAAVVP